MKFSPYKRLFLPSDDFSLVLSSKNSNWRDFAFAKLQITKDDGYVEWERNCLHIEHISGPLLLRNIGRKHYENACLKPTLGLPDSTVSRYWIGRQSGTHLLIYPDIIERFTHQPFNFRYFNLDDRSQAVSEHILRVFHMDVQAGHPSGTLLGETLLMALLQLLSSQSLQLDSENNRKIFSSDRFGRLIDFIDANLTETLSLEDLARESRLSVRQVCRIFKDEVGMSPYHYIITCRVNRAKKLIESTRSNFEEIAAGSGFAHAAHMTNAFRKILNATPSQFSNSRR